MQRDATLGVDQIDPPAIAHPVQARSKQTSANSVTTRTPVYASARTRSSAAAVKPAAVPRVAVYGSGSNTFAETIASAESTASVVDVVPALRIDLKTVRGPEPTYHLGDTVKFAVSLSQSGYLYCYYRDGRDAVARVFPNRFQTEAFVEIGQSLTIPGPEAPFRIVLEQRDVVENVMCVAAHRDMSEIAMRTPDLTPMPVDSMDQVVATFEDNTRSAIYRADLDIRVDRQLR